jgi:glycosyltransferase involved in cell wall biosynthesis
VGGAVIGTPDDGRGTASMPLLTLIVPTYNEGAYIADSLRAIVRALEALEHTFEVLVVCDGSTDHTATAVAGIDDPRIRILSYNHNHGKGHAICFGVAHAHGSLVGWIDADLDIDPRAIVTAVRRFERAEIDGVIGSKRHRDSEVDYPPLRRVLSWGFQRLARSLVQVNVRDTQVGAKVFRREMLDVVVPLLLIKRYAFDLELLAVGVQFGFDRIEEMPVRLHYRFTGTRINTQAVKRMFVDTLAIAYRIHLRHWYVRRFSALQRERTYAEKALDVPVPMSPSHTGLETLTSHP